MPQLDANIPLGGRPPAIDPMQAMSSLLGMQGQQQQLQANRLDLATKQRGMDDDSALRSAMQRRTRGNGLIDWDGAIGDLEQSGNGPAAFKLRDALTKQRKEEAETLEKSLANTQTKLELATRVVQGIEVEAKESPTLAEDSFQRGKKYLADVIGPQVADQLGDRYDPTRIKAVLTWGRTASDQLTAQRDAATELHRIRQLEQREQRDAPAIAEAWTKVGSKLFSVPQSQEQWTQAARIANDQGMPVQVQTLFGDQFSPEAVRNAAALGMTPKERADVQGATAGRTETARHNRATEANAAARLNAEGATPDLTPAAKDTIAHQFAMTGQMPALGMGKQATTLRTEIMNRSAELYQNLDLPSQQAAFRANQGALGKMVQQKDAIEAFENTALANLEVFEKAAQKVVDTGSPYLNRPLRQLNERLLGSPQMAAFNTARTVVVPEFARIIANPNLTGVLSDSARREVDDLIKGDATLPQILAVTKVLKQDAANRRTSMDQQIKAIQGRIATPPGGRSTGAGTSPDAGGAVPMRTPDGSIRLIPADKVKDAEARGAKRLSTP